jgi:hypothetical protein
MNEAGGNLFNKKRYSILESLIISTEFVGSY